MNKTLIATALAAALAAPALSFAADAAPTPTHTFTPNVGVVSNYLFRGVSQTHGGGAVQGGVDYAHSSGLYAGVWASSITWVKDWLGKGSTEIDIYGGYKSAFAEGSDWTYDVGMIHYAYPGSGNAQPTFLANPKTTEVYGAISYKWVTLKYSNAITQNFIGWYGGAAANQTTRGSDYLEINANYDLGDGWGVNGHYGTQKVKNSVTTATVNSASYDDWKIGVTKDVGFGVVGLAYSDTNVKGTCPTAGGGTNPYCWGTNSNVAAQSGPAQNFKDVAKGTVVLTFNKAF
jgi:uncharacterized protein (TIGR02001 family)